MLRLTTPAVGRRAALTAMTLIVAASGITAAAVSPASACTGYYRGQYVGCPPPPPTSQ